VAEGLGCRWYAAGSLGQVDIVSTRRLEGVPMPMGAPVAYRFTREGWFIAHVDVLDAGQCAGCPV